MLTRRWFFILSFASLTASVHKDDSNATNLCSALKHPSSFDSKKIYIGVVDGDSNLRTYISGRECIGAPIADLLLDDGLANTEQESDLLKPIFLDKTYQTRQEISFMGRMHTFKNKRIILVDKILSIKMIGQPSEEHNNGSW